MQVHGQVTDQSVQGRSPDLLRFAAAEIDPRPDVRLDDRGRDVLLDGVPLVLEVDPAGSRHTQAAHELSEWGEVVGFDECRREQVGAGAAGLIDEDMQSHLGSIGARSPCAATIPAIFARK
ncbi:hypothetical protein [Actinokineospora sp. HUAS TT18]|uniref:hypothetical protein n=1 Tax=Actinokineospora sp. HUAS TT18 TaxID=3447451 RepID=UPI003F5200CB